VNGPLIWVFGLSLALTAGFAILLGAQSFVRDIRTQQTRYWIRRTASRAAHPGWYWLILVGKAFSIVSLSPTAILGAWIVVAGVLRVFSS
jgi:hypothetical protein